MTSFSSRLKSAMGKKGMTGADLAREIGVVKSRVYQILDFVSAPPAIETVIRAAEVLGVSLDWLLLGKVDESNSYQVDQESISLEVAHPVIEYAKQDDLAWMIHQLTPDQQRMVRIQVEALLASNRAETKRGSV